MDLLEHRDDDVNVTRAEVETLADATEPEALESMGDDAGAFSPVSAFDLIFSYPNLRPVVVADLLREGETMNVVAAPKVGKSWLIHALLLAVASGQSWLGKPTSKGCVLLIDAELHRETLARRLRQTQSTLGVSDADMRELEVWPVRGQGLTIDDIAERLANTPMGRYRLIVLDALYRFLPAEAEENSNETITHIYNTLDAIASRSGASVVVVHHASKGSQTDKAVTDVGSGAGAQSRAADTHLILRPHEEEDAVVVDAAVRSFPPMNAFVVRSTKPGWTLATDLNPQDLRRNMRRGSRKEIESPKRDPIQAWTPEAFAIEIVGHEWSIREDVIARAIAKGIRKGDAEGLLKRAEVAMKVHRHQPGPSAPPRFSIDPPTLFPGITPGGVSADPAPGAFAPGGMGGTGDPPPPSPKPRANRRSA